MCTSKISILVIFGIYGSQMMLNDVKCVHDKMKYKMSDCKAGCEAD